jgi:hypothetical protein
VSERPTPEGLGSAGNLENRWPERLAPGLKNGAGMTPLASRAALVSTLDAVLGRPRAAEVLSLAMRRARLVELPRGVALADFAYGPLLDAVTDLHGLLPGIVLLRTFGRGRRALRVTATAA